MSFTEIIEFVINFSLLSGYIQVFTISRHICFQAKQARNGVPAELEVEGEPLECIPPANEGVL
jgi:hypothetical protein